MAKRLIKVPDDLTWVLHHEGMQRRDGWGVREWVCEQHPDLSIRYHFDGDGGELTQYIVRRVEYKHLQSAYTALMEIQPARKRMSTDGYYRHFPPRKPRRYANGNGVSSKEKKLMFATPGRRTPFD